MKRAAATAVGICLLAWACSGESDATPTPSTTQGPSPSQAITSTPSMELPPEEELLGITLDCLRDGPDHALEAAERLVSCAESADYLITASGATGDPDVVLVDFQTTSRCFRTISVIGWRDTEWHVQSAESLLPHTDPGTLITAAPHSPNASRDRARAVTREDSTRLGIIQANAECGSGPPSEGYLLLALKDDIWELKWASRSDARASFGYPAVYFVGHGIDHLHIDGNSFARQDDRRRIFKEHKLGPHRLFQQDWVRQDDVYILESERVLPTPYARLVDFVYGISHHAESATEDMVTNLSLVQKAIDLALAQDPIGQEWTGYCAMESPPCHVEVPDRPIVAIDMIQSDGHWLVSGVSPE